MLGDFGISFAYQVYTHLMITDAILDAGSLDGEGATVGQVIDSLQPGN